MAEKDSGRYRYEPYPPLTTKQQNNGTNTLKKNEPPTTLKTACSKMNIDDNGSNGSSRCCSCVGPKTTSFWVGLLTNLGICTLLFAYTLLGKFYLYFIFQSNEIYRFCVYIIVFIFFCRIIHIPGNRGWCFDNATANDGVDKSSSSKANDTYRKCFTVEGND